jgi:hypothetical protein
MKRLVPIFGMVVVLTMLLSGPYRALQALPTVTPANVSYLPLVAKNWPPIPRPEPSPHLVWYAAFARITDLPLEELSTYTNALFIYHRYDSSRGTHYPSEADLQRVRAANIQLILKVDNPIVEDTFDEAALRQLKNHLDPYKDVIYTILVIDEPYKPSKLYTYEFLRDRISQVKDIFEGYPVMINFLNPSYVKEYYEKQLHKPYPDIPDNIDIISFDTYYYPADNTAASKQYYEEVAIGEDIAILREKAPGKPILFVSTAFSCFPDDVADPIAYCQEHCSWLTKNCPANYPATHPNALSIAQAQWDYEIVIEQGIDGLAWYYYDETRPGGKSSGASVYPLLIEKHKEIGNNLLGAIPSPVLTPTSPPGTPSPPPGDQVLNTLVVRVNLADGEVSCSEANLDASTFGTTNSINAVYSESSRGTLSISGSVTTADLSGYSKADLQPHCEVYTDPNATMAVTINNAGGIDPADYDKIMYVLPPGTCGWGGNLHSAGKYIYTTQCDSPRILAHELGHSLGFYHASTDYTCNGRKEYMDHSDPMGDGALLSQFNGPHLVHEGWLPANAVLDVTTSGTYNLEATEVNGASHPQILRIKKPGTTSEYYYLSLRRPIGLDTNLVGYVNEICNDTYLDQVTIHRFDHNATVKGQTHLVDLLGDGQSFTDTANGITITKLSQSGNVATVQIGL